LVCKPQLRDPSRCCTERAPHDRNIKWRKLVVKGARLTSVPSERCTRRELLTKGRHFERAADGRPYCAIIFNEVSQ